MTDGDNITEKKGHGPGVAFADYDGDGFTDIYVANDRPGTVPSPAKARPLPSSGRAKTARLRSALPEEAEQIG